MSSNRNKFDFNYLYKHKNNTDVAFQVVALGATGYSQIVSIRWFNIVNPENIYLIDYQDSITVVDEKSHDWIKFAVMDENKTWKVVSHEATLY